MRLLISPVFFRTIRAFSHDVTFGTLEFQNNKTAAMLVFRTNPVGIELFSNINAFFCRNKFGMYKLSAISVTESSWAVLIPNVDSHISDRSSLYRIALRVGTTSYTVWRKSRLPDLEVRYTWRWGWGSSHMKRAGMLVVSLIIEIDFNHIRQQVSKLGWNKQMKIKILQWTNA